MQNNPDFRFNRMRKSGKTEFLEVHIERAPITYFITGLFVIFRTFFSHNAEEEKKKSRIECLEQIITEIHKFTTGPPRKNSVRNIDLLSPRTQFQLIWTLNATLRAQCKAMRCVLTASYKN